MSYFYTYSGKQIKLKVFESEPSKSIPPITIARAHM